MEIRSRFKKYIMAVLCAFVLLVASIAIAGRATYTYDNFDRLVQVTYENGPVVTYNYDAAGNLQSKDVAFGANTSVVSSYILTVSTGGASSGTVVSTPAGIDCGADCSEIFQSGTFVNLSSVAGPNSVFTNWSGGGCSGTGTCSLLMNEDKTVTAIFSPVISIGLASNPGINYDKIGDAYTVAIEGDVIKVEGTVIEEIVTLGRPISVTIAGGYNSDLTSVTGITTLKGYISVNDGVATIENIEISP